MAEKSLFSRIIDGEIPSEKVYEDEAYYAFRDIHPAAPEHVLIVPKKVLPSITDAREEDRELLGGLLLTANKVAKELGIDETGFRCVINCGRHAGQEVPHLHLHVLGGRLLDWPPG
ncbi:MAG: histidine triad nucleotide-binding protein [Candidatus Hydrogenedentes bacterium]|jgi:histidine triad (HIT) family protein|nr:histidine triad nucleotide-binding protein [Candidatus Hydrogenedentota bacterium]